MSNTIRILNKNFLQFVAKDSAKYPQHVIVTIPSVQYITWSKSRQIFIHLDDQYFELLYNTPEEASIDHTLLTNLLSNNDTVARWDMPVPDLMTDLFTDDDDVSLKPNIVIHHKNTELK